MLRKILIGFLVILLLALVSLWVWWPKNLILRGPILDAILGRQIEAPSEEMLKSRFTLPAGFRIGVYAKDIPHARMMAVSPTGDIAVTSMRAGEVILLHRDENGDGKPDGRSTVLTGLDWPHGIAFYGGDLYVAEMTRIIRAPYDSIKRTAGKPEAIFEGMPKGGNHRTRTIGFGPSGWLYVTIGSSCNVCIEKHPYRAAMLRMRPDGSNMHIYATGLRNSVGFDWQPATGRLYATDNGRDLLGDNMPNCEINQIEEGQFYGWPYTFDDKIPDPDLGLGHMSEINRSRDMVHGLGAHVAPLGIRFLKGFLVPDAYKGAALVAEHGSWNRRTLSGYKVVSLYFKPNGAIEERDFLTGFEKDGDVIGRPVDIVEGPDGAIYISDDYAGAIYRISWGGMIDTGNSMPEAATLPAAPAVAGGGDVAAPDMVADIPQQQLDALIQEGDTLYREHGCVQCHESAEGVGTDQTVKMQEGLATRYSLEEVMDILDYPASSMPRPDITDDERKALAVFLLTRDRAKD